MVNGTVWIYESYVHVRWGWMGFLAAQMILGCLFLVFTIMTSGVVGPVLKSSTLAVLFALGPDARAMVGGIGSVKEMERRVAPLTAKKIGDELIIQKTSHVEEV